MRKGTLISMVLLILFVWIVATPDAAATYGRAHIWIPEKKDSLLGEKFTCEKEAKPRYIAWLKKKNPEIDEKELSEKIIVQADEETGTIILTVPAEDDKTAVANAEEIAKIAVARLFERAQSGQMFALKAIREEREITTAEIRASESELAAERRDSGMYDPAKEMDSLVSRLNSYKEELIQAEMKNAVLGAKLELFSKKAAQVKDTVSAEEIAALEKTAQQLATQLSEAKQGSKLARCQIILMQKESELKGVSQLHKQSLVSEGELKTAEAEYELARNDYEAAKSAAVRLTERLGKVRDDLAKAKEKLAETGGLALATIIAEKTLECESELAGTEVKRRYLLEKINNLEKEIAERGSTAAQLERRKAEIDGLKKRLAGLLDSESAARAQMRDGMLPQIVMVESLERLTEPAGAYSVIGEVRSPGSYDILTRTTVLKALATAGGYTDYADDRSVVVVRYGKDHPERHNIDVNAILKGKAPDDFIVRPGDIIWVPSKGRLF